MPANFGTQPARPPFAWPPAAGHAAGVSKAGAPMPSGAAAPTPPYGTRCLIGTIHRPACIRAFRAFQRGNLIRVTFVCRCVALPCCLCARLISFDILAPTISQSAQCRQIIAHKQRGLHLGLLLRCSSTQGAAGRNLLRTRMGHAPTLAWDACYARPLWVTVFIIYN